jgi:hypothetical protein
MQEGFGMHGNAVHTLRALGGPSRRFGMVGVACTVGLERVWLGESVVEANTGLVAR